MPIAKDFERQCAFYKSTLGLALKANDGTQHSLAPGDQSLAVFARSHHPQGTKRLQGAQHGLSHLEFGLNRRDHIALFGHLNRFGAQAYGENFQDADGILFHFNLR